MYMDRHDLPGSTSPEEVARAHVMDLEVQERHGVRYVTYWFDPASETAFCLADAPSSEAALAVHEEAHGLMPAKIIEVDSRMVQEFLGRIIEPQPGDPWVSTAFRVVLFTDIEDSTSLTQRLGDAAAMRIVRDHDEMVRAALEACDGHEVKHTGDGIMASFTSVSRALRCANDIQRKLAERNAGSDTPFLLRIGLSAGEPVTENDDLFGVTVQAAARLCARCAAGGVLVSSGVRELAAGKGFNFEDRGELSLKGFSEPLRVYALHSLAAS